MTIFLIIISIVFVVLLSLFFGPILYRIIIRKKFKKVVHHKLYNFVNEEDFLLRSGLYLELSEKTHIHIDHFLCGDRFIYLISDKYLYDGVYGSPKDKSFFYYKNGKVKEINNSVSLNRRRVLFLSKYLNWENREPKVLISIVVTNNDTVIDDSMKLNGPDEYFVHLSEVTKVIKEKEYESDLGKFSPEDLERIMEYIGKLSDKSKK